MQDNLSLYHIFYTVARTGSISHSSRNLYISQPAISKAIQKLEQNLDTVLFKRSSRGVTLTPDGELLFETHEGQEERHSRCHHIRCFHCSHLCGLGTCHYTDLRGQRVE